MDTMNESYRLDTEALPFLPVPHDCVIKNILVDKENQCISFVFEDDLSGYDSIAHFKPGAKSLVIKYHLDDVDDYELYKSLKPSLLHRHGGYKCLTDVEKGSHDALIKLTNHKLEYISHYVAYKAMIIELWAESSIILKLNADTVEYEWKY